MADDLPPRLREANRVAALVAQASQQQLSLRDVERAYVLEIVRRTDGNKSRAADILGLDRKTLYRKLAEYAQEPESADGDTMSDRAGKSSVSSATSTTSTASRTSSGVAAGRAGGRVSGDAS
jgi:hypothetical protein